MKEEMDEALEKLEKRANEVYPDVYHNVFGYSESYYSEREAYKKGYMDAIADMRGMVHEINLERLCEWHDKMLEEGTLSDLPDGCYDEIDNDDPYVSHTFDHWIRDLRDFGGKNK